MARGKTKDIKNQSNNGMVKIVEGKLKDLGYENIISVETKEQEGSGLISKVGDAVPIYVYMTTEPYSPVLEGIAIQEAEGCPLGYPTYLWLTNGEINMYFELETEVQVQSLPMQKKYLEKFGLQAVVAKERSKVSYKELQYEFDHIHEVIYSSRDAIDNKNDAIDEMCKLIFLEVHRNRQGDKEYILPKTQEKITLNQILEPDYIKEYKEVAVTQIKEVFQLVKEEKDYIWSDNGHSFRIFREEEYLKLTRPSTYEQIFTDLRKHTLSEVPDDILGRVFDVMLRRKFDSKGGLGIYLTPRQVTEAMARIALNDISDAELFARDVKGRYTFRVCDPCCGSGGFLIEAIRIMKKRIDKSLGLSPEEKEKRKKEMMEQCIVGADNAPGMVLKARINMVMHGAMRTKIFQATNSLTDDNLEQDSYNLIMTNPPFGKTAIDKKKGEENIDIIKRFSFDINPETGVPNYSPEGLALGSKPSSKGVWAEVNSIDPAVLFIDRCLQLLKPGGKLLIVLPDGILSNSGYRYLREYMMGKKDEATGRFFGGKGVIKAVVSLPPDTFGLSGAGAKTSFVYVQKKSNVTDEQGAIFMAIAEKVGFEVKQNSEQYIERNDLVPICEGYEKGE